MTLTKITFAASTLIIAATTATFAQEGDKKFSGPYVGIEAGYEWNDLDDNFLYSGIIGYRKQMDNDFVFGLEGTFGDTGYDFFTQHSDYEWSTSLTFGKAFGSNLWFAKAGYVNLNIDTDIGDFNDEGWRFGGGYERAINDSLSLRLGADHTSYDNSRSGWQTKAGILVKF